MNKCLTDLWNFKGVHASSSAPPIAGVIPLFSFESRWVRMFVPGVDGKPAQTCPVTVGLIGAYGMDGYKARDSLVVDGMAQRLGSACATANIPVRPGLDHQLAPQQMGFADLGGPAPVREIRNYPLMDRSSVPGIRPGDVYRF